MSLVFGVVLFAAASVLFLRLPLSFLTLLVGAGSVGIAAYQWVLALSPAMTGSGQHPERAVASLVAAGLLFGSSLLPLTVRRAKKGPPRRNRNPRTSTLPTLAGVRATAKKNARGTSEPLSKYEIGDRIGIGGMATVYKAIRRDDRKVLALKIPQEKFVADAKFVRRFHREAEVLMRLNHPNILKVYEHANEGTTHYIAMELIEGDTLEALIEQRRLTIQHSVEVMKLAADALRYIHKQGIIHRDIKPGNIMVLRGALAPGPNARVDANGVKLMDFGIAAGKVLTRLTMTGARVGTPVYMSPEQARGIKLDHRSDIYSLGLVFYEMVTGTTAFKGGYEAVVHQQIFQSPPPPRQVNLEVSQPLNDLIMRMIEKDPDKRPTLTEVIEAIEGGLFRDKTVLDSPTQLVLSLNARRGVLRLLDNRGNLERSLGQLGAPVPGGTELRFPAAPIAVATDADLNVYAAVFEYRPGETVQNMVHKITPDGQEQLSFGPYGMKPGELLYPTAITVSPDGHVFVLDGETHVVQRFSADGEYLGKFGGRGRAPGTFDDPRAIIAGPDNTVYVLDYGNRRVQRFTADGQYQYKWSLKQRPDAEDLRVLDGIGVDQRGTLYISDALGGKIRAFYSDRKQGQTFALEALQGEDTSAILDIGVDHQGFVYAGRRGGHLIRRYSPDGQLVATIETYAPLLALNVYVRETAAVPEAPNLA